MITDCQNDSERGAWCTVEGIRERMASRQSHVDALVRDQDRDRQLLAEALCPFRVGQSVFIRDRRAYGKITEISVAKSSSGWIAKVVDEYGCSNFVETPDEVEAEPEVQP